VKPGVALDDVYMNQKVDLVVKGCENLVAHIETVQKSGVRPVVCVNRFHTDTDEEVAAVRKIAEEHGALCAVSEHWGKGGEGARELAEAVVAACEEKSDFRFLYDLKTPLRERIELIAKDVYGARSVTYSDVALQKAKQLEADDEVAGFGTCMVKTHLSLSHDPDLKGRPRDWDLPISDIHVYRGAGFVVPMTGAIKLMPGTGSDPAFRRIDVDAETGKIRGLF